MVVAEYCGNCDKRTLRKVGACPECTPKVKESQTTDTQQLKAEIASVLDRYIGKNLTGNTNFWDMVDELRQLSAD